MEPIRYNVLARPGLNKLDKYSITSPQKAPRFALLIGQGFPFFSSGKSAGTIGLRRLPFSSFPARLTRGTKLAVER